MSSGDLRQALPALLGPEAAGLSPSAILRLTKGWTAEYDAFRRRDLTERDYVYLWADGIHFTIRLEEERLCTLLLIGVRPDGTKEVVALEDGYRESAARCQTVLATSNAEGCARRCRPSVTARWASGLPCVSCGRRRWSSDAGSTGSPTLDKLPKRLQLRAKQALHEIMYAETRATAEEEIARFIQEYDAKYPKAVASLTNNQDRLLAYFDYPFEHWKHLRTTNPIESTFATVRLRDDVTKGAGSRTAGLVMAFKLVQVAGNWRRLDGAEVPLVRAGSGSRTACRVSGPRVETMSRRKSRRRPPPHRAQSTTVDNSSRSLMASRTAVRPSIRRLPAQSGILARYSSPDAESVARSCFTTRTPPF